jgi:hypothetical protein
MWDIPTQNALVHRFHESRIPSWQENEGPTRQHGQTPYNASC